MSIKIITTDKNGVKFSKILADNTVKGYIIKDGQIVKKSGYEEENNNVIVSKQKPKNSIFYIFKQFISKLLNK